MSEFRVGCLLLCGGSCFWFSPLKNAMYTTAVLQGTLSKVIKESSFLKMLGTSCLISHARPTLLTRLYWQTPRHTMNLYASGPLHILCPLPAISPSLQTPNTSHPRASQCTPWSTAPHLQGSPLLRPFLVPTSWLVTPPRSTSSVIFSNQKTLVIISVLCS